MEWGTPWPLHAAALMLHDADLMRACRPSQSVPACSRPSPRIALLPTTAMIRISAQQQQRRWAATARLQVGLLLRLMCKCPLFLWSCAGLTVACVVCAYTGQNSRGGQAVTGHSVTRPALQGLDATVIDISSQLRQQDERLPGLSQSASRGRQQQQQRYWRFTGMLSSAA